MNEKKILKEKEVKTQNFPILVKCFGVLLVDKYVHWHVIFPSKEKLKLTPTGVNDLVNNNRFVWKGLCATIKDVHRGFFNEKIIMT